MHSATTQNIKNKDYYQRVNVQQKKVSANCKMPNDEKIRSYPKEDNHTKNPTCLFVIGISSIIQKKPVICWTCDALTIASEIFSTLGC